MNRAGLSEARSFDELLQKLEEQAGAGTFEFDSFAEAFRRLQAQSRKFQELLQWATEELKGRKEQEEFERMHRQVAGWNASRLFERLKNRGFSLKQDRELKEAFERQGYRILELVRSGKRAETFYALMRIFVSAKKEFPASLLEAFKPVYSPELFKVFLFSFLSGILGKEQEAES